MKAAFVALARVHIPHSHLPLGHLSEQPPLTPPKPASFRTLTFPRKVFGAVGLLGPGQGSPSSGMLLVWGLATWFVQVWGCSTVPCSLPSDPDIPPWP